MRLILVNYALLIRQETYETPENSIAFKIFTPQFVATTIKIFDVGKFHSTKISFKL